MAFTCRTELGVTDEESGVETVNVVLTERTVSVSSMLDLEGKLLDLVVKRLDAQTKKMVT